MKLLITLLVSLLLMGCTTSRYGDKPIATDQQDTYRFKVYVGGFAGEESASKALTGDLDTFKDANGFKSYSIVTRFYNPFPSYFDYTVKFVK